MLSFMREGGYAMWVILVVGGAGLVTASLYARRPQDRLIAALRTLSMATVFVTLSGVAAGFATTLHGVAEDPEMSKEMARYVMIGLAESLANAILGFSLLGIAWLVAAVGARKVD